MNFIRAAWLLEQQQDREEHQKHAERRNEKNLLDRQVPMHPSGDQRSQSPANIYQRVINGIANRARTFFRCARRSTDNAGLYQCDSERGQHEDDGHQNTERKGAADGRHPRRTQRTEHEIRHTQNEISERKRAPKAESVRECPSKGRQKPDQSTKQPR